MTNLVARNLRILQNFLDGIKGRLEQRRIDFLEARAGDVGGEIFALIKVYP